MSIHKRTYKRKDGRTSVYYLAIAKRKGFRTASKQFDRKIDAEAWEREQRVLLKRDPSKSSLSVVPTVARLSDHWLESFARKRLEYSSVDKYDGIIRNYIVPRFGGIKLTELTPLEVEGWLDELRQAKRLSSKSINGCLVLLRKMLNDAVHWKWISHNPIQGVRPYHEDEREFDFWTVAEGERFLKQVRFRQPKLFFATAMSLYTGMRLGEIQALKWDCIDLSAKQITVKRTYCQKEDRVKERTKTKRMRRIPVNDSLSDILIELRGRSDSEFVLPDFDYHRASLILKRTARKVGVKPIRFHDLRHSFASNFVMAGGEIYKLQRLLGHCSIQMTERYSHLSPDHLVGVTDILDFGTRGEGADVIQFRDGLTKS